MNRRDFLKTVGLGAAAINMPQLLFAGKMAQYAPAPKGVQHGQGQGGRLNVTAGTPAPTKELSLAKPLKRAYSMGTVRHRVGRITAVWVSLKEQCPNAF